MKFNTFAIVLFLISTNIFYQGKLNSHNDQNGGCKSHCYKNESIFNDLNTNNKNIKFKNKNNLNSCINNNLCRG